MLEKYEYKTDTSEWLKSHTLTPEQLKQLIAQKLERARIQSSAVKNKDRKV